MKNCFLTRYLAAATLAALACGDPSDRSALNEASTYIERLGIDTFAIETFERTPNGIEGRVLVRSPETLMYRYHATVQSGRLTEYELEWLSPAGAPDRPPEWRAVSRTTVSLEGDSALVRRRAKGVVTEARVWAPAGVIPIPSRIPPPPLLAWAPVWAWRQAADRLRSSGEPLEFLHLGADQPKSGTRPAVGWGRDSVGLRVISDWTVARLDDDGSIRSISGRGTTVAVEIERSDPVALDSLATDYAARDARGEGLGHPSPPTRVNASLAGAALEVYYSRPAVRGRRIWGDLVPFGEVWRTGANLATHLQTDRDLELGGFRIPAGSYTLWTLIEPSEAWLIVNRQTQQWGTQYDPERDLVRVPMEREELEDPVELLTIDIRASDGVRDDEVDGWLRLAWDRTRFIVPIRVP